MTISNRLLMGDFSRRTVLKTQYGLFYLVFAVLLAILPIQCSKQTLTVTKDGNNLYLKGSLPSGVSKIEVRLYSDRNKDISSYHQVSHSDPDYKELSKASMKEDWGIYYPVVDVVLNENMEGVMGFQDSMKSSFSVNAMFNEKLFNIVGREARVQREFLLNWENNIYLQPFPAIMKSFYISDTFYSGRKKVFRNYRLLSDAWSGEIVIIALPGKDELKRIRIEGNLPRQPDGEINRYYSSGLSRERLIVSLAETVRFTMNAQDSSDFGQTRGGLNLFYDLDAQTYRRPTWIRGWGPSVKLLLDVADIPEIAQRIPASKLKKVAMDIGEASLLFQEADSSRPEFGIITSRWSENKGTLLSNYGFEQYFSIADAQFLAGWGWIPLFIETGDQRYLDGVILLTEATDRLIDTFDLIPMDYMVRAGKWKDYALNEQGFGTEGINALHQVDSSGRYREIGDEYMKMLLNKFETPEGIWNRRFMIEQNTAIPPAYHTRGVGWAMEGLLAVYELTGDEEYLAKAVKISAHLIDNQLDNGSWSYNFRMQDPAEISEKGTALWSLLFYKLFGHTNDQVHLEAARNSLIWCLDNQYDGSDIHARGGIIGISRQSGVIYRKWFPLACTYTSGFFGLAVLEELKLMDHK